MNANRFDALRLAFSGAVFIYHLFPLALTAVGEPVEGVLAAAAALGVQGFFVISGALVWRSLEASRTLGRYAMKRVRRLAPAYAVIIAAPTIAALVIAVVGGAPTNDYVRIGEYFFSNIAFLNFLAPDLPGLFEANSQIAVNGALWTIKIEVAFYIVLPLLAFFLGKAGRWRWALLALVYGAGEAWRAAFHALGHAGDAPLLSQLSYQLPGQMGFFAAGIALALLWDAVRSRPGLFALAGGALFALSLIAPLEFLRPAALMGLIAGAAFAPGPALDAARWGDLSYGVYITHYPIIQTFVALGLFAVNAPLAIAVTAASVIIASLALWRWIEQPFLFRDSHYRQASSEQGAVRTAPR